MSLAKSSLFFAAGTFLSRLTGVIRESVTAGVFGASFTLDSFLVANRIPNLLRELLAEGALGASFSKVYAQLWEIDQKRAKILLHDALRFFTFVMIVVCALGMIFSRELVLSMTIFMPSSPSSANFIHNTTGMTRLLFPFIAFMAIGAIVSAALYREGKFFLSALSPILLNLGYILGALYFSKWLTDYAPEWVDQLVAEKGITGLALGVLLGGFAQFYVQYRALTRSTLKKFKLFAFRVPHILFSVSRDLRKVLTLMGPMIIAGSAGQINVLVNTNFATYLGEGAVTWLNCSFRLLQLPIGIFAIAVSSTALPAISKSIAKHGSIHHPAVVHKLEEAIAILCWLLTPCLAFFWVNSLAITELVYQHGQFDQQATLATSETLFFYSFSLLGYGLVKVLTSFYYAMDRTQYAMKVGIVSIGVNFLANYLFVEKFAHKGLAMTASLVITMNALFLAFGLKSQKLPWRFRLILKSILCLVLSLGAAVLLQNVILLGFNQLNWIQNLALKMRALLVLSLTGMITVVVFSFAASVFFKTSPKILILKILKKKRTHGNSLVE